MKKIKICYITKNLSVNGISNVILNYCRGINKNLFDITIFTGPPVNDEYRKELELLGLQILDLPPKRGKNPLKYYFELYRKLNKKNCDIVHVHGNSATIILELFIALVKGIHVRIAHCHNTNCDMKIAHRIFKPFLSFVYTNGYACSKEAGIWMFGSKKFDILPNGFQVEKFKYNEKIRNKVRKKLNIENSFVIGHVGLFNNQKNHPFIIDTFEIVAKNRKNAKLLLVGSGPNFGVIKNKIDKSKYRDRIICYGVSKNVAELYDAMDMFFFPSKYEGLGIVLLEAQMKGLPCVVSSVVPKEVKFLSEYYLVNLEEGVEKAAKVILTVKENNHRNIIFKKYCDQIKKYDIKYNVGKLEKDYIKMFANKK